MTGQATHWKSEWIQALWSQVSCVWSLQGLFPQEPLQRTTHSCRLEHFAASLSRKLEAVMAAVCELTHWLSGGVRVSPGAGTLVAFGVCCRGHKWGVGEQVFHTDITITTLTFFSSILDTTQRAAALFDLFKAEIWSYYSWRFCFYWYSLKIIPDFMSQCT